jgi:hypothetical protein
LQRVALGLWLISFFGVASGQFVWVRYAPTFTDDLYGVAFPTLAHGFVCGTRRLLKETLDGGRTCDTAVVWAC